MERAKFASIKSHDSNLPRAIVFGLIYGWFTKLCPSFPLIIQQGLYVPACNALPRANQTFGLDQRFNVGCCCCWVWWSRWKHNEKVCGQPKCEVWGYSWATSYICICTNISTSCTCLGCWGAGGYLCYFTPEKRGVFSCTSVPAFYYLSWKRETQVTLQGCKGAISSIACAVLSLYV